MPFAGLADECHPPNLHPDTTLRVRPPELHAQLSTYHQELRTILEKFQRTTGPTFCFKVAIYYIALGRELEEVQIAPPLHLFHRGAQEPFCDTGCRETASFLYHSLLIHHAKATPVSPLVSSSLSLNNFTHTFGRTRAHTPIGLSASPGSFGAQLSTTIRISGRGRRGPGRDRCKRVASNTT